MGKVLSWVTWFTSVNVATQLIWLAMAAVPRLPLKAVLPTNPIELRPLALEAHSSCSKLLGRRGTRYYCVRAGMECSTNIYFYISHPVLTQITTWKISHIPTEILHA